MHLLLDLAIRRGHLNAAAARRLQAKVEGGRALTEVLREAGLSSAVVSGLAAELQAAAQGVTQALPVKPRPSTRAKPSARQRPKPKPSARQRPKTKPKTGTGPHSAKTVLEPPPGGARRPPPRRERDHETEWLPKGEDYVAPSPPGRGEFNPGDRIGDFELIELLGEGGMGAVYRAKEVGLGREVALKLVSAKIVSDPEAKERFLREARSAGQLNHPNVITILRVSEHQGRPYMILEYLRGGDAEDLRQAAGGKLEPRRALEIIRDCAKGLGALEARGLVHRDIKPANVFLTARGVAKLADLGLARTQVGDDRVTQTGVIVGTPTFMAPEQAEGDAVDIRSDIYALGATLFLLVTGRAPFVGKSPLSVMAKILSQPTPDPRLHVPELPAAVARVVLRAMSKEREERYQTSAEFLGAVEETLTALREGRADAGPAFSAPNPSSPSKAKAKPAARRRSAGATAVASRSKQAPAPKTGRAGPSIVAVAVFVLVAGVGLLFGVGVFWTRPRAPEPPITVPQPSLAPTRGGSQPEPPPVTPSTSESPPAAPPGDWSAPPGVTLRPPQGTPKPLNFGTADLGGSEARRLGATAQGVVYRFEPGRGDFARSALFGGSKLQLPTRIVWQIRDLEIDEEVAAGHVAEAQGLGDRPTGVFFEFGVRPQNTPCVEAARLEPGALWVTLQIAKGGEVIGTFRRLNSNKVDRINLNDPGVGHVHPPHRGKMQRRRLKLELALSAEGWRFEFANSTRLQGRWSEGPAPLTQGEIKDGLYLWTQGGNWARGRGRGTLEVELLGVQAKQGRTPLERRREPRRGPRRPRKR